MHAFRMFTLIKNGIDITVTLQLIKTTIRRDKSLVCWQEDSWGILEELYKGNSHVKKVNILVETVR